MQVINTGFDIN